MEMQATDLSARLLATENLTVVRSNVPTASFDIKSRVLTLPMWKEMTPEIEDMLVGHEVGHALYTGEQYIKPIEENPKMMSYLNIIEDVRIEKLIKRKYPGLRKRMNEGYKQLNDRDFFGLSKLNLEEMNLIDRINIYFKAGFQSGVKFDADERHYVNRAERVETIDDVIQLAQEIYDYAREQAEKKIEMQKIAGKSQSKEEQDDMDQFDNMDPEFGDEDDNEDLSNPTNQYGKGKGAEEPSEEDEIEKELESKTEQTFSDNLEKLADQSTVYRYHKLDKSPFNPIIPYKRILQELNFNFDENHIASWNKRYVYNDKTPEQFIADSITELNKFKADSTSSVNYLVKEFEMRKSAHQYKRAQISKTGSLDMRKVYAYKLQDDLFKRVTVMPNGKNHGMMFLLDWSGSMSEVIMDTLKQVINLCMFCNKAQIPYEVFAFTTQYMGTREEREARNDYIRSLRDRGREGEALLTTSYDFHLLELFSNRMSMSEFNAMTKKLLDRRVFWHNGYDLGGTPLNDALVWVYQNLGEYMKANRIEKMNFITLTDGAGASIDSTIGLAQSDYVNRKHVSVKNLVRDEVTKKTYQFTRDSGQQTETLIKMIKDHYGINVVGFYVCRNKVGALNAAIRDNIHNFRGNSQLLITEMRKKFKEQGFYSMNGTGRDDLFIVPLESTKIEEGDLSVTSEMNARALSKNLGKYLGAKKTSRVLLSRFIDYVA